MKFEVITKLVSNETKRKVTILADGVEIGSRTSAHTYRFALVVTGNQAHAITRAEEGVAYSNKMAVEYGLIANRDEQAIQRAMRSNRQMSRASIERYIVDGSYAKWAEQYRVQGNETFDRLTALRSGPDPKFSVPVVASWHSRHDLVPNVKPHQTFVAIVSIPE